MAKNTELYICEGIAWPNDYSNVRLFSSAGEQSSYITGKAKFPGLQNLSYIRDNDGRKAIRVNIDLEDLKACNYIAYRNTSYSTKWQYAFIDRVMYINDGLSLIYFTLDWFQTYLFDMTIQPGFVEREHVNDDTVGANTVDEPFMTGPFICDKSVKVLADYEWYFYATEKIDTPGVTWYNPGDGINIYSGMFLGSIGENLSVINSVVSDYTLQGKLEAICSIFARIKIDSGSYATAPSNDECDGYTPKNNKLKCYPYQYINISAPGTEKSYRYEYFNGQPIFGYASGNMPGENAIVFPSNYLDSQTGADQLMSPEYVTVVTGIPTAAVLGNSFANSIANNPVQTAMSFGQPIAQTIAGAYTGNMAQAAQGVLGLISATGNLYSESLTPHDVTGSASAGTLFERGHFRIKVKHMTVKAEYAKIIDDMFDMLGYRICRIKAPNITGRASWNFVKMQNAIVSGDAPAFVLVEYEKRLNSGMTFWHVDDIGNYSLSNNIVGGTT